MSVRVGGTRRASAGTTVAEVPECGRAFPGADVEARCACGSVGRRQRRSASGVPPGSRLRRIRIYPACRAGTTLRRPAGRYGTDRRGRQADLRAAVRDHPPRRIEAGRNGGRPGAGAPGRNSRGDVPDLVPRARQGRLDPGVTPPPSSCPESEIRTVSLGTGADSAALFTEAEMERNSDSGHQKGRMNSLQQPHEVRLRGLPASVLPG